MNSKILIIAGSDPSGGAGIQADIKTSQCHKVYSSAVMTCLTAQNTKKVTSIHNPPISFLRSQLQTLFDDIQFDAIKIGMLGTKEIIEEVALNIKKYAKDTPIILDPVICATSGDELLKENAIDALKENLIAQSLIITPNIDEAKILSGIEIKNLSDMKKAAQIIKSLGAKNVLVKGGHLSFEDGKITSVLLDEKTHFHIIRNKKIEVGNVHGTGCTLASAIACNISKKEDVLSAIRLANSFVYRAIKNAMNVGKGSLILNFK